MRTSFTLISVSLLLWTSVIVAQVVPDQAPPPEGTAGRVVLIEGDVKLSRENDLPRRPSLNEAIKEHDHLATGPDGEVHLSMQDSGFIALRPNTQFAIEQYKADGADDDHAIYRLLAGGFRSISGWIGRFNSSAYQIRTPTATIGIRGTDHEPRFIPEGSSEGEPGTYDRVFAGETVIETPAGSAPVTANQAGFASSRRPGKPRLLAGIPVFFKPSPHEAEIAKKHLEIQKQIEQRRDERRKELVNQRAALAVTRGQTKALAQKNKTQAKAQISAFRQQQHQLQERRASLKADIEALNARRQALQRQRAALQADVGAQRLSAMEVRQRRQAMKAEARDIELSRQDIEAKRKTLEADTDAAVEQNYERNVQRVNALHEQQGVARQKRDEFDQNREATRKELTTLHQNENRRFRDELKADQTHNAETRSSPP